MVEHKICVNSLVNLAKQTLALEKMKRYAKLIRVKNNVESRKKKERILLKSMQVWQHGLVKLCNGIQMMFKDLQSKYQIEDMKTAKVNQDALENLFGVLAFMSGNGRNFGALDFRRLLRNYILGGGNVVPIPKQSRSPVEQVLDSVEPDLIRSFIPNLV